MTMRQTAAARVVEQDFQVTGMIADLHNANEIFAETEEGKLAAQRSYDATKRRLDQARASITEGVINETAGTAKITQAEIDRRIKSALHQDADFQETEDNLYGLKAELDVAVSIHETARIQHRTLVANLNAASAALNFLTASKTARAIALQNLSDL